MNILINVSNLTGGGGVQVADSICSYLYLYPQHHFVVVYSNKLAATARRITGFQNVEIVNYNYPFRDLYSLFFRRNIVLDALVKTRRIDCVLTLFGPMKWCPKCEHICGFALSQLVIPESPYFKRMAFIDIVKARFFVVLNTYLFKRGVNHFYTENLFITERVRNLFPGVEVRTITNNYNQVFDTVDLQKHISLPLFKGFNILSVISGGAHKNVPITIDVARCLVEQYGFTDFRFIITVTRDEIPTIPHSMGGHFLLLGKVDIEQCPSLYEQSDIVFQPTLLECFTAAYPEAMRTGKPIVTTDLEFARSLCGDAALFYDPLNAESAAKCIYELFVNERLSKELIQKGYLQLKKYDTSRERAEKLVHYCEEVVGNNNVSHEV